MTSGGSAARAEDPDHAGREEPVDDGGHLRVWFRSLMTLAPAPSPRWSIALQAALSMFLPLGLFTALGRGDLGLQAAGGAFVATYLTAVARRRGRVRSLSSAPRWWPAPPRASPSPPFRCSPRSGWSW
ncbi:hypothetical protein [Microbacterium azadirachtae]|uniref:hypothetical protein n=1 Tax=Microbacterium azadirachtae TaxID=582680 RepID=UPI0006970AB7|nr:hypothetical protein [Microbacterium azadirachtae]